MDATVIRRQIESQVDIGNLDSLTGPQVLRDVTPHRARRFFALLGPSGSGKSSVAVDCRLQSCAIRELRVDGVESRVSAVAARYRWCFRTTRYVRT